MGARRLQRADQLEPSEHPGNYSRSLRSHARRSPGSGRNQRLPDVGHGDLGDAQHHRIDDGGWAGSASTRRFYQHRTAQWGRGHQPAPRHQRSLACVRVQFRRWDFNRHAWSELHFDPGPCPRSCGELSWKPHSIPVEILLAGLAADAGVRGRRASGRPMAAPWPWTSR